jgi:general stress protein YciG
LEGGKRRLSSLTKEFFLMPGTREGGLKAASTNKKRYGKEFYTRIGAVGGKKSRGGGFAANPELARSAGAKGGRASRRGKAAK